jgi:anti-sigma B factor antagonist
MMTDFSITEQASGGMLRLDVSGEVDLATGEELAAAIRGAITSGTHVLLTIDLDRVTFLDSMGINVLVAGRRLADEHGVAYLVTNPNGLVHQVLEITGVLQHLSEPSAKIRKPLPSGAA